jgi:hypothetical protein
MLYLKKEGVETLALRDLGPLIDGSAKPDDPLLGQRIPVRKDGRLTLPAEVRATQADLAYWLDTMARHRYTPAEVQKVAGSMVESPPAAPPPEKIRVLPYPGGRPLRIGFREGAIDPLRGTKASVFFPQDPQSYVVVDLPEAIFSNLGLLFLAHTHVPTIWNAANNVIENVDWQRPRQDHLESRWTLPNGVAFGARIQPKDDQVEMELWLQNGTKEPLTHLRTQICVLLKESDGFNQQTNDNKTFGATVAEVRSSNASRRIRTEWEHCGRTWGNAACPCMHSDPVLPDCAPGETVRVSGRLWYETA